MWYLVFSIFCYIFLNMAFVKIQDASKTRENMNEKSKIVMKNDDKRTHVIAQEIKLAKILAGNNKTLRDRALKHLKRWFQFRSNSNSTPFTENDFMRIWKGLFYAMWMSDKPLLQEECAEMIASLVHLTTTNYSLMFFKCGLQTLGNEWFGIDQLRLDKFLMFVRRLLRQGFVILRNNSWNLKTIKEFNNVLSATILSIEHPPPVGLTMHFTEVYLEELSKVSEGNLKPNLLTEFVSPFVKQLAMLNDNRQITCIMKNIFRYLIRQSDVGMEYAEKFKAWKSQGFPGGSIDSMQKEEYSDDEEMSDDEIDELNENKLQENALDPRAGHLDVALPQLKFISKQIIQILNQNKFSEGSNSKSRKAISTAIEEFTLLSIGQYPFGMKKIEIPKDDGYSTRTRNAVNRLVKFENKLLNKTNKKRKQKSENNIKQQDIKRKKKNSVSATALFAEKLEEFIKKSEDNITVDIKGMKKGVKILGNDKKVNNNVKSRGREIKETDNLKLKRKKLITTGDINNKTKMKTKNKIQTKLKKIENRKSTDLKKISKKDLLKEIKRKLISAKPDHKNYECAFERNSGTWFVYEDDPGTSMSSTLDLSTSESVNVEIIDNISPTTLTHPLFTNQTCTSTLIKSPKMNGEVNMEISTPKTRQSTTKRNPERTPVKSPHSKISKDLFKQNEWDVPMKEGETEIFIESRKYRNKMKKLNNSLAEVSKSDANSKLRRRSLDTQIVKNPFAKMSPPSSSKKVKIALNLNKAQDIREHVAQIKSSPGIPFDANKKPSKPLLKRHSTSSIDPFYRRKLNV